MRHIVPSAIFVCPIGILEEAAKKRVSSSSGSSRRRGSSNQHSSSSYYSSAPVTYDPNDIKNVNFAAILAGMGVKSGIWDRQQPGIMDLTFRFSATSEDAGNDEASRSWGVVMALLRDSLELPSGSLGSIGNSQREIIQTAEKQHSKLMQDTTVKALVQKAQRMKEEERKREEERKQGAAEQGGKDAAGGGRLSGRLLKVCIGCGGTSSTGKMQKCSRCRQAYACSPDCFATAWAAFHKHSCRKAK